MNSAKNLTQRILMIDDDSSFLESTQLFLQRHYFTVAASINGEQAIAYLTEQTVDLIILDKLLAEEDGVALSQTLRQYSQAPILMLTGVDEDIEQIVALETGISLYLSKPINPRVLLAYIRTLLRKKPTPVAHAQSEEQQVAYEQIIYQFADWQLNTSTCTLQQSDGVEISLTATEYALLLAFVTHPNRVLSRDQLLDMIQRDDMPFDRSIDIMVSRLRRKLAKPDWLKTIRNSGYLLATPVNKRTDQIKG